jgi:hypothetical protein
VRFFNCYILKYEYDKLYVHVGAEKAGAMSRGTVPATPKLHAAWLSHYFLNFLFIFIYTCEVMNRELVSLRSRECFFALMWMFTLQEHSINCSVECGG